VSAAIALPAAAEVDVADPLASALDSFVAAPAPLIARRALLHRAETKFTLAAARLPDLLPALARDYAVVRVPSGATIARYASLYFDTGELRCFHDHRRGRRIRHKVRIRHYADRRASFLEVKTRRNERVVDKQRLAIAHGQDRLGGAERAFLRDHVAFADALRPHLWIDYRRITLIGAATHERVTIDVDLAAGRLDGTRRGFGPRAVIEVKQAPARACTPVIRALAAAGLRDGSSSKYVTAVALLRPEVRNNRLLPALRAALRIEP
jgi:hypothetical protein